MPPVFIQPGLGDSLNRYLERLGRRGEEQRALQARRDNLQASMDARHAANRTRMISQSINQSIGLVTNEMQRDRASERKIGEAEELQYLEGLPGSRMFNTAHGLSVRTNDSALMVIDRDLGIPGIKDRLRKQREESPNTMGQKDKLRMGPLDQELLEHEKALLLDPNDPQVQADYAAGVLDILAQISAIHPSGPPKETIPDTIRLGTGRKSESNPDGNNLPIGEHWQWNGREWKSMEAENGARERNDEMWKHVLGERNPASLLWEEKYVTDEEQEAAIAAGKPRPSEYMTLEDMKGRVFALQDAQMETLMGGAGDGDDNARNVAEGMLAYARIAERDAPELPKKERETKEAMEAVAKGGPTAFEGIEQVALDRLLKQGVELIWPDPIMHDGKLWRATYVGGGKVDLDPYEAPAKVGSPSRKGLVPPGVMKQ